MRKPVLIALIVVALVAAACSSGSNSSASTGGTVTLVSHDSFAASKPVLRAFTKQTGLEVKVLKNGDAGAALNQVIITKDHPLGDAFFGVDNTFLSRALKAGIFEPFVAGNLDRVPASLRLDPGHRVTPIDYGDVCVNYDKAWFASRHLAVPKTLEDLTKPAYRGKLVTENAATSSPGLAFVLATIARYGPSGWTRYWQRLRANDVKVVDGWDEAYDSDFSAASGHGSYPLVVSYASSPPAEVVYDNPKPKDAPTGVMTDTCFRQVEFAGVLRGAGHPKAAQKLIDFMLTRRFQADVPLQMYVFPARSGTPLPTVFTKYAAMPEKPLTLSAATIGAHRDAWIQQWTDTVLR